MDVLRRDSLLLVGRGGIIVGSRLHLSTDFIYSILLLER